MTPTPQSDEWIEVHSNNKSCKVFQTGNKEIGYKFCLVDKSLLDQLRQDAFEKGKMEFTQTYPLHKKQLQQEAKKELLDWALQRMQDIRKEEIARCGESNAVTCWFILEKELRAKTLGDKDDKKN